MARYDDWLSIALFMFVARVFIVGALTFIVIAVLNFCAKEMGMCEMLGIGSIAIMSVSVGVGWVTADTIRKWRMGK